MAESGERRMLFDTRGKRKNVIRVVYAALALLMGASLFVAVGPFNLAEIIGTGNQIDAAKAYEERIDRIEARLAKEPENEELLLALLRAQFGAGNANVDGESGSMSVEAVNDLNDGLDTWAVYLNQAGGEPNANAALLVAGTAFALAERGSSTIDEVQSNVTRAVEAQRIAAKQQPSVGAFSTLAIYEYFDGNQAAGDKAKKEAVALAPAKAEKEGIEKQLAQLRSRGAKFNKEAEQASKALGQADGGEQLQNPFGLGPPGGVTGE